MPAAPALPVVTAACLFLLQAGHGCGLHPAFPAPSFSEGHELRDHPGKHAAGMWKCVLFSSLTIESDDRKAGKNVLRKLRR